MNMLTRARPAEHVSSWPRPAGATDRRNGRSSIRRDVEDFDPAYRLLTGVLLAAAAMLVLYGLV
jgi:hypothetical protein